MRLEEKIKVLIKKRCLTPALLRQVAGLSRATMHRILQGHQPAPKTLARIAEALDVSPGYLRGGYQMPAWLTEEDIMFLADRRNVELLQIVRRAAQGGVAIEDLQKLIEILSKTATGPPVG